MFSLEAPQSKRKQGNFVLASLTDSLHLQQPVWHSGKVQVAAPRVSAKRVPRQQLRVASTSGSGPPVFLLTQHDRAIQAALWLRQEVRAGCFIACKLHFLGHLCSLITVPSAVTKSHCGPARLGRSASVPKCFELASSAVLCCRSVASYCSSVPF